MEPAWVNVCGRNFASTSRTVIQPNGGTREVPCYSLTKTESSQIIYHQCAQIIYHEVYNGNFFQFYVCFVWRIRDFGLFLWCIWG